MSSYRSSRCKEEEDDRHIGRSSRAGAGDRVKNPPSRRRPGNRNRSSEEEQDDDRRRRRRRSSSRAAAGGREPTRQHHTPAAVECAHQMRRALFCTSLAKSTATDHLRENLLRFCSQRRFKEAIDTLENLDPEDTRIDFSTYACLVDFCGTSKSLSEAKRLHAHIARTGPRREMCLGGHLVSMFIKCGSIGDARRLFNDLPQKDKACWTTMIAAYAQRDNGEEAMDLFRQMKQEGIKPDTVTFVTILNACSCPAKLDEGKQIHSDIIASGVDSNVVLDTALLTMYARCGSLLFARWIFDNMPQRNVVTCTAMIGAYVQHGLGREALDLFGQMCEQSVIPNRVTYITALSACASLSDLKDGKHMHSLIVIDGFETDVVMGTALITMYSKCGSLEDACNMFDRMPKRNAVSWTTMIASCVVHGCPKDAIHLFEEMCEDGIEPSKISLSSTIDACAGLKALTKGKLIHALAAKAGYDVDVVVGTAIVNLYGNCKCLDDAEAVFKKMPIRDLVSWTVMIRAYGDCGHDKEALNLFKQMHQKGVNPDEATFLNVLSACNRAVLVDEGIQHFKSMSRDFGLTPAWGHYVQVLDLYFQAGRMDEAEDFINGMPSLLKAKSRLHLRAASKINVGPSVCQSEDQEALSCLALEQS